MGAVNTSSFQNNGAGELAASVARILEITRTSNTEVYLVNEKLRTTRYDDTDRLHTLTHLDIHRNRRSYQTSWRCSSQRRSVSKTTKDI